MYHGVGCDIRGVIQGGEFLGAGMNSTNDVEAETTGRSFDKTRSKHQKIATNAARTKWALSKKGLGICQLLILGVAVEALGHGTAFVFRGRLLREFSLWPKGSSTWLM